MSSKTYNLYGITAIVGISGFMIGLETSSLSAFLTSIQFNSYFGRLDRWDHGIIGSSNSIGAVGCIVCGSFCDAFGCIKTFQASSTLWICGSVVAFFLPYIYVLVLGRVVKGFSIGLISAVIPIYVSETLPNNRKGWSMSLVLLSSTIGSISMYFLGYFFQKYLKDENSFKYSWAIAATPAFMLFILGFFLPESPKWLASHSRWLEAAKNLDRVRTVKKLQQKHNKHEFGNKEYVIRAYTAGPEIHTCSYSALFTKSYWKFTFIGIVSQVLVQLTCISTLMYFSVYLCRVCGLEEDRRLLIVTMQYIILGVFTIFPVFLLDRCRRIDSLVFGMFTLGLSFAAICIITILYYKPVIDNSTEPLPFQWRLEEVPASTVLALFLFLVSIFSSTIVSAGWLYTGEIFPVQAKSKGSSVCMCASWIVNAILMMLLPFILKLLGFWLFAVLSVICFGGSILFLRFPETRDLSDVQVEALFSDPGHQHLEANSLEPGANLNPAKAAGEFDDASGSSNTITVADNNYLIAKEKQIYEDLKLSAKDTAATSAVDGDFGREVPTGPYHVSDEKGLQEETASLRHVDAGEISGSDDQQSGSCDLASFSDSDDNFASIEQEHIGHHNKFSKNLHGRTSIAEVLDSYVKAGTTEDSASLNETYYSDSWFDNRAGYSVSKNGRPLSYYTNLHPETESFENKLNDNDLNERLLFHFDDDSDQESFYQPATFVNFDTLKVGQKNRYFQSRLSKSEGANFDTNNNTKCDFNYYNKSDKNDSKNDPEKAQKITPSKSKRSPLNAGRLHGLKKSKAKAKRK